METFTNHQKSVIFVGKIGEGLKTGELEFINKNNFVILCLLKILFLSTRFLFIHTRDVKK